MEDSMSENSENRPIAVQVSGVKKMYKLGQIGGGSLQADLQSWWAKVRHKEDPNSKIGEGERSHGKTFMALNGVDLTIYQGEAVGIIGSNGAGKSTLLKLLSRVTAPTEGIIDIYGRIASMLEVGTGFNPEMTGRENVYLNGAILGMTKTEIDAKMEDIIEFSEVREFIDTPVKRYSSGMFVKLAFSVAAHLDSEIMIMDEVLAVGDMAFQKKCLSKMKEAANQDGRTVLYVSHNMNTIRTLCDRCIVLDKGKVVFEGETEEAIQVYMGSTDDNSFPVSFNYEDVKRMNHFGKDIFVKSFHFVNKDTAKFQVGEQLLFAVEISSKINIEGVQLILRIKDKGNTDKIAASLSKPFDLTSDKTHKNFFSFKTDSLAEAQYCLSFEIIKTDITGNYFPYDNPMARIAILIEQPDSNLIFWSKQYWGNIRLQDTEVYKEVEE